MKELTQEQEKWIEALESGKYKQMQRRLRSGPTDCYYCCLGVACEISGLGGWTSYDYYNLPNGEGDDYKLPVSVAKSLNMNYGGELKHEDGNLTLFHLAMKDAGYAGNRQDSLIAYNDTGATFKQIAYAIREVPEAVFFQ